MAMHFGSISLQSVMVQAHLAGPRHKGLVSLQNTLKEQLRASKPTYKPESANTDSAQSNDPYPPKWQNRYTEQQLEAGRSDEAKSWRRQEGTPPNLMDCLWPEALVAAEWVCSYPPLEVSVHGVAQHY